MDSLSTCELETIIEGLLMGECLEDLGYDHLDLSVRTYQQAGMLTNDDGLEVRDNASGSVFCITIKQKS